MMGDYQNNNYQKDYPDYPKKYGYSKKSLWKWIVIYIVIGVIVYGLIYYFFFAKSGGYNYDNYQYPQDYQYSR